MIRSYLAVCVAALVGSCSSTQDHIERIEVGANPIGVVAIEIDRIDDERDRTFELRGLNSEGVEIAAVRLNTGELAELPGYEGDEVEKFGAEIVLSAGAKTGRLVTREIEHPSLVSNEPEINAFLALTEVSTRLTQAGFLLRSTEVASPSGETAFSFATSCATNSVMTTPLAKQCCSSGGDTTFINAPSTSFPNGQIVYRYPGTACRMQDGSTCSGAACFFGPNGYSKPALYWNGNGMYPYVYEQVTSEYCYPTECNEYGYCYWACTTYATGCGWDYTTFQVTNFGNVTGTIAAGGGCCSNSTGPCNVPGAPSCSSCGGNSGAGSWSY